MDLKFNIRIRNKKSLYGRNYLIPVGKAVSATAENVEKFEGRSLMSDVLGVAELSTLQEVLEGTEYKEALDKKAETILGFYKNALEQNSPAPNVQTMVKAGHPAEQIIEIAAEEDVSMILIGGSKGKRASSRLLMGSVSREVANGADRPVLIVK